MFHVGIILFQSRAISNLCIQVCMCYAFFLFYVHIHPFLSTRLIYFFSFHKSRHNIFQYIYIY